MHYCRFQEHILTSAYTNEIINDSEKQKIYEFWEYSVMYNLTLQHVNFLKEIGFELEEIDSNQYKITKWPFLKIMHLLVCKQNPKKWIYQDENGDFLFSYVIDSDENTFSS